MDFVSYAFVLLSFAQAFAAPPTLHENDNGVENTILFRDEPFSEHIKLRSATPQGRDVQFVRSKGLRESTSAEESGESASTEDSDESSATDTKVTETKSESASIEDSDVSALPEVHNEQGQIADVTSVGNNNVEEGSTNANVPPDSSQSAEEDPILPREEAGPEQSSVSPTNVANPAKPVEEATGETGEIVVTPRPKPPKRPKPAKATTASPLTAEAAPAKPVEEPTSGPVEIAITPKPKPPKRPKPAKATTASPLAAEAAPATDATSPVASTPPPDTDAPTRRYPCRCAEGLCSCCTGLILENFNVPIRSRACANVTYEPDDFAFNFKLSYNDRVLYDNRVSAKNPRPACIPINRYFGVKMCAKVSNVYMSGRNVHACLDLEGFWDDESAFKYSFNCFRIGTAGVAIVRPEDGGGLPPPPDEEPQTNEDYDDSARGWTGDVQTVVV